MRDSESKTVTGSPARNLRLTIVYIIYLIGHFGFRQDAEVPDKIIGTNGLGGGSASLS